MEGYCQVLNELTEIHTLISDIVEDGLVAITLVLHVANLHVETQALGYLTTLDHGRVLASLRLTPFLDVVLAGYAIDTFDIIGRLDVHLLELQFYQAAC